MIWELESMETFTCKSVAIEMLQSQVRSGTAFVVTLEA